MAPINNPNGNEVSEIVLPNGNTASEVIAPDGTTVFGAIPDSVVDNFEDADSDPRGVYESGESISDYYRGAVNGYSRTTTNAEEGSKGLDNSSSDEIYSLNGDGLNTYPSDGDTVACLLRDGTNGDNTAPYYVTHVAENTNDIDAYAFMINDNGSIRIYRIDDGSFTELKQGNPSISDQTWYWAESVVESGGSITYTLYEADTSSNPPTKGSEITSISTTDSNHTGNTGIGFGRVSSSGGGTCYDWLHVV